MKLDRLLPLLLDVPPGRLRVLLALQSVCIRASRQLVLRQGTASASELAAPVSPPGGGR